MKTLSARAAARSRSPARAVAGLAALALCLAASANGEEDGSEGGAAARSVPKRVVSCAPHLTETMFALGAEDLLIGADEHSNYPPEAKNIPRIGDLFAPDFERLLALEPDALLLAPSNRKIRDFFADRGGVALIECNDANSLDSIRATIRQLGGAFAREREAERAVARMDAVFDGIDRRAAAYDAARRDPSPPRSFVMLLSRRPGVLSNLYAFQRQTFLADMAERLGLRNALPPELPLYPQVTLESLLVWNPDVIVEVHGDKMAAEPAIQAKLRADWAGQSLLDAGQRDDGVVILADARLTIPGPNIGLAYATLALALRPDVFGAFASAEELVAACEAEAEEEERVATADISSSAAMSNPMVEAPAAP